MEFVTRYGDDVPKIGLGTWQMDVTTAYDAVSTALEVGYQHIDTAQAYENEAGVGRAIEDADVDREEHDRITRPSPLRTGLAMIRGEF